jgi:hypothetical protein
MFSSIMNAIGNSRIGRWCCLAAMAVCLSLSGCTCLALRDDGFRDFQSAGWTGGMRRPDVQNEFFGASNKARQVERDCGIR